MPLTAAPTRDQALDEQREVIAFLSSPQAYGRGVEAVERIDTHISIVWLAGDRAYKLKRAVRFDYVDFSTTALRSDDSSHELCTRGLSVSTGVIRPSLVTP